MGSPISLTDTPSPLSYPIAKIRAGRQEPLKAQAAPPANRESLKLREAIDRLAGDPAIVTGRVAGRRYRVLVYSTAALSLHPPRVLFCANKAEADHDELLQAERVTLSAPNARNAPLVLTGRIRHRFCAGESTLFIVDVDRTRLRGAETQSEKRTF